MVQLIDQEHVAALITLFDGNVAHQAEQIANKVGVPILTLASDATSTQTNVPWIFRIGPSDEAQVRGMAENIYLQHHIKKILLIAEKNHDGRLGRQEFARSANLFNASTPLFLEVTGNHLELDALRAAVKEIGPEAVVLWTDSDAATELLPLLRETTPEALIYACQKAVAFQDRDMAGVSATPLTTATLTAQTNNTREVFAIEFPRRTGHSPNLAAHQIYDAIRLVAAGLRTARANRARLRDQLAKGNTFQGISGEIRFDPPEIIYTTFCSATLFLNLPPLPICRHHLFRVQRTATLHKRTGRLCPIRHAARFGASFANAAYRPCESPARVRKGHVQPIGSATDHE